MSQLKEVIETTGDVRRTLAQTMVDVRTGAISVDKALAVAALSKALTDSIQSEVNVAKVRVSMLQGGNNIGKLTELGRMTIDDHGSVPTLSGQ